MDYIWTRIRRNSNALYPDKRCEELTAVLGLPLQAILFYLYEKLDEEAKRELLLGAQRWGWLANKRLQTECSRVRI